MLNLDLDSWLIWLRAVFEIMLSQYTGLAFKKAKTLLQISVMCFRLRLSEAFLMLQEPFCVDCRHAPRSCGGYGLPIHAVLNVAARKHARHTCFSGTLFGDDVAIFIEFQLPFEQG
jgi:hypothetical protein